MSKSKKALLLLVAIASGISLVISFVVFTGQAQTQREKLEANVLRKAESKDKPPKDKQLMEKELDDAATPIVDYDAPNKVPLSKDRVAKSARYDGRRLTAISPRFKSAESTTFPEFFRGMPDLPVGESDLIVEGEVTESAAYLSNDSGVVYSEFTIRVTDVVKTSFGINVNKNDLIITQRLGGRVRYSDGRITRYNIHGQGSPMKGKKYLLFLTRGELGNYNILTGYELRGRKVFPLDGSHLTRHPEIKWSFDRHKGVDYQDFQNEVIKAKNNPSNRRAVGP